MVRINTTTTSSNPCLTSLGELIFFLPLSIAFSNASKRSLEFPGGVYEQSIGAYTLVKGYGVWIFKREAISASRLNNDTAVSAFALSACTFGCALRCAASVFLSPLQLSLGFCIELVNLL